MDSDYTNYTKPTKEENTYFQTKQEMPFHFKTFALNYSYRIPQ